jgi:hypothetical protein
VIARLCSLLELLPIFQLELFVLLPEIILLLLKLLLDSVGTFNVDPFDLLPDSISFLLMQLLFFSHLALPHLYILL